MLENLTDNILPYWMEKMKDPYGGFYGRRDGYDRLEPDAPKGAILHARILWTFAAAFNTLNDPAYLYAASHAADFILHYFIDEDYGGTYWSVKADGSPLDTKKQFYAIAFIIYGLSEYYIATGDRKSLDIAFYCLNRLNLTPVISREEDMWKPPTAIGLPLKICV